MRVPLGRDELRGKVVWRATRRVCLADGNLSQPHVCELHMPVLVEKKVLGLQITEDYLLAVQVLEGECRAGHIELGAVLLAPEVLLVVGRIQLAAERQLEEQVERLLPVEGLIELDDKGRVAHELHVLLAHDARLHSGLHDVALAQGLERVGLVGRHVLHHLHGTEAAAAEEPQALQVLAADAAEALGGVLTGPGHDLLDDGRARLAAALELVERAQQHVEGRLVHGQGRGRGRGDANRGPARLVLEQGLLAEELRLLGRGGEPRLLLAVDDDAHRAVDEDVEEVALLALLEDVLAPGEGHLAQRPGELELLLVLEGRQDLDLVQVLDVLLCHLERGGREDVLELMPVDDHHRGFALRNDGRGARRNVHQRELAEALSLCQDPHVGLRRRRLLSALPPLRHENLETSLGHNVEIVSAEIALRDDLRAGLDLLLPHDIDHLLDLAVIQGDHGGQVCICPQSRSHDALLLGRLWAGRLRLDLHRPAAPDRSALWELQLFVQAEVLKRGPGDAEGLDPGEGLDGRGPRLVTEQRVLAKKVAGLQPCHCLAIHLDTALATLDDVEDVAVVTLLDDDIVGIEGGRLHGFRERRVL
mmetsp:Transcript_56407/g.160120  ORF Transcript_56407/g.160120 Transcript_56407/m.160120 type:complete len:590 (-) Transcript_56407:138-1907(-)